MWISCYTATAVVGYCWWECLAQDSIASKPEPSADLELLGPVVPATESSVSDTASLAIPSPVFADVAVEVLGVTHVELPSLPTDMLHSNIASLEPSNSLLEDFELNSFTGKYDSDICVICYESPQINKSWSRCGHVFCYECLNSWCEINIVWEEMWSCPCCKQVFNMFQDKHATYSRNRQELVIKEKRRKGLKDSFFTALEFFIKFGSIFVMSSFAFRLIRVVLLVIASANTWINEPWISSETVFMAGIYTVEAIWAMRGCSHMFTEGSLLEKMLRVFF